MLDIKIVKDNISNFVIDPLLITDEHKNIQVINEALRYLLGYKEEEILGKSIEIIFADSESLILRRSNADKLIGTGTILNIETYYQTKNGKTIPVLFSSSVIRGEGGNIMWIICTARDITERKKVEEELRSAYEKIKEAQDQLVQVEKLNAVGLLASGVAHEVKNPLGVIIQGVNYLQNKLATKDNDLLDTFSMIMESANKANRIVNMLLDFAKAKKLELKLENINNILGRSLELVKANIKFEKINIHLDTKNIISHVFLDKNRIEQVFINLIMNSIQAMPDGGKIFIRSYDKVLPEAKQGTSGSKDYFKAGERVLVVEIEDTGMGIPAEAFQKIFNPFFTTKGLQGGSGIGLYVSRNIIDMHSGLIEIQSTEGKGTKVSVLLRLPKDRRPDE